MCAQMILENEEISSLSYIIYYVIMERYSAQRGQTCKGGGHWGGGGAGWGGGS